LNTMFKKSNGDFFVVYLNYKNFLKQNGKKFSDPFRRKQDKNEKDYFMNLHGLEVKTRLAQLNYFKWAFENEIVTHIENNFEKIEKRMNEDKKKKKSKVKEKYNRVNMFVAPETVSF